jgi:cytoplasmic FMR1 interacting protein
MEIMNEDNLVRQVLKNEDIYISELSSSNEGANQLQILSEKIEFAYPSLQSNRKAIELYLSSALSPTAHIEAKGLDNGFAVEFEMIGKIEALIAVGNDFIAYLYSYRSLSKALPEINIDIGQNMSNEEKNELVTKRNDINRKVFDIMKPTIIKLKELISFVTTATTQIYDCVIHLINLQQKNGSVPDDFYDSLLVLLDILIKIDNLKDMKPSVQNDFSRYKRALGGQFTGEIMDELTRLQNFLTSPQDPRFAKSYIFLKLRGEVKNISGHEEILFDLLSFAYQKYDAGLYVGPESMFCLIRVVPYLIVLIDGNLSDPKSTNVFKTYKSKLVPYQKLCRKYPFVPLYGDMTIGTFYVIQRAEHFDISSMTSAWSYTAEDVKLVGYDLSSIWESLKSSHQEYLHRLSMIFLQSINSQPMNFQKLADDKNLQQADQVYQITQEGIKLLTSYSIIIKLYFAWKYSHPATENELIELNVSEDEQRGIGFEYAKAIRYNITKEDIYILSELISMMKSLANMVLEKEPSIACMLRYRMHARIQTLVQIELLPLLHRVDKKNKQSLLVELLEIRTLAADWIYGVEPREDYKTLPSSSSSKAGVSQQRKIPARVVSTSPTQLKILRSLVHMLYDEQSSVRRKEGIFFSRSELRSEDIQLLIAFYNESYFYSYLLNLSGNIRELSDVGDLWYREFYLELAKCVQFPIELSIPWMMVEHLIVRQGVEDSPVIENIFYVLDIYNDAAYRSLHGLQQQHLYDEIEAETNLVFDQFVFLLAEEIYTYYKNIAASNYLDRPYRYKLEELKALSSPTTTNPSKPAVNSHHLSSSAKRYEVASLQRSLSLLGRTIDLNYLLSQHISNKFYRDIDIAIRRFEAYDLTGIVELGTILTILQHTHSLLRSSHGFMYDDFSSMLQETNESFSPTTYKSRISFQILRSLVLDIYPNYSYNLYTHRFVRCPIILRPVEYSKPPKQSITSQLFGTQCHKAYEHWLKLTRGYFGRIHYEYLLSMLIHVDLFMIIEESLKNLSEKLVELKGYIAALHGGIPPLSYPKYSFQSVGSFGYFEGKLKSILEYDDLKPEVYQGFREVGNTIAFLRDLSDFMDVRDGFEFINLAPFLGIAPDTNMQTMTKIQQTATAKILKSSSDEQLSLSAEILLRSLSSDLINRSSLIQGILGKIEDYFYELSLFEAWAPAASPSIVLDVNQSQAFHKLWSALIFLYCLPQKQSNVEIAIGEEVVISDEEEFGHGFAIAGCLLIHMLEQRPAFELMDFSSHVMKVYEAELMTKAAMDGTLATAMERKLKTMVVDESLVEDTENFIDAAVTLRKLQEEIFAWLNAQHKRKSGKKIASNAKKVTVFHPTEDG